MTPKQKQALKKIESALSMADIALWKQHLKNEHDTQASDRESDIYKAFALVMEAKEALERHFKL